MYTPLAFSADATGRLVEVAAVASPGTPVHQAEIGLQAYHEIYLFASNRSAAEVQITIEWGGVTTADRLVDAMTLPPHSSPIPIATGQRLNNGLLIRAFASVANVVNLSGWASRIS